MSPTQWPKNFNEASSSASLALDDSTAVSLAIAVRVHLSEIGR
jgi:hypothetical protein